MTGQRPRGATQGRGHHTDVDVLNTGVGATAWYAESALLHTYRSTAGMDTPRHTVRALRLNVSSFHDTSSA